MLPVLEKYYKLKKKDGFFYDEKSYNSNVTIPFHIFIASAFCLLFVNFAGCTMLSEPESFNEFGFNLIKGLHFTFAILIYGIGGGLLKIYFSFKRNINPTELDLQKFSLKFICIICIFTLFTTFNDSLFFFNLIFDFAFILFIFLIIPIMREEIDQNPNKKCNKEMIDFIQNEILADPEIAAQCFKESTCSDLKETIIKEYFEEKEEEVLFNAIKNKVKNNIENI